MNNLIIFDMDGTVLDTLEYTIDVMNASLRDMGYQQLADEEYKPLLGASLYVMSKELLQISTGRNEEAEIRAMIECISKNVFADKGYRPIRVFQGMKELITYLKQQGFYIAILSNTPHDMAVGLINNYLSEVFDGVYGEGERIARKPSSQGVEVIMKELHSDREHTIMVGDTLADVKCARNAQVEFIGVTWGVLKGAELEKEKIYAVAASNNEIIKSIEKKFYTFHKK